MAAKVVKGNERQHKLELNENGYTFISVVFRRTPDNVACPPQSYSVREYIPGCNFTEA